jgi:hypothetical protein
MNPRFDRNIWMCPIIEVVSWLSDAPENEWIFRGKTKLEDTPGCRSTPILVGDVRISHGVRTAALFL